MPLLLFHWRRRYSLLLLPPTPLLLILPLDLSFPLLTRCPSPSVFPFPSSPVIISLFFVSIASSPSNPFVTRFCMPPLSSRNSDTNSLHNYCVRLDQARSERIF